MKASAAFALFADLWAAIRIALPSTLKEVALSPSLLLKPTTVSRIFMSRVWQLFGPGIDENTSDMKTNLITADAHGVVLDLGAGHGHTSRYLDHQKVTKYVALEPNVLMHPNIRATAQAVGFSEADDTLVILSSGAEDTDTILSSVGQVDTIVSVLTLCSVPSPEITIQSLVKEVLRSGGTLVYHEHVRSHREDVAWWQSLWTPLWSLAFDGCKLDRPTNLWIDDLRTEEGSPTWKDRRAWGNEGEPEEHLWWHQSGRYIKA